MTLDEAIKHCEEKAKELRTKAEERPYRTNSFSQVIPMSDTEVADCLECAREHKQLAEWLKELKILKRKSQGDLISREALKEAVNNCFDNSAYFPFRFLELIDNAPTVEPKQGEWVANPLGDYVCNKCSWVVGKFERNFCPNCGAKMKGGAE